MSKRRDVAAALSIVCLLILTLFPSVPDSEAASSDLESDSADPSITWYRDQLDPAMRYAYDKVLATDPKDGMIVVTVPAELIRDSYPMWRDFDDLYDEMYIPFCSLTHALYCERPEMKWGDGGYGYYFDSYPSLECTLEINIAGKEGYQNNSEILGAIQAIGPHGTDSEKVTQIHNYLAVLLSYAYEELDEEDASGITNQSLRDADVALIGTHKVVCGGYSKAFKMVCDYYEIPNAIVYGDAGEYHTWNLVLIDGFWYMVDLTWDDKKTGYKSSYLLCGMKTVISGKQFCESHVEVMSTLNLKLPEPLAQYGYWEDVCKVTFDADSDAPYTEYVLTGDPIDAADKPSKEGLCFTGWYLDAERSILWGPEDSVTSDIVLYAKWSEEPQYTLFLRSDGDNDMPMGLKADGYGGVSIPSQAPTKGGHVFTGWNTRSDGLGTGYQCGDRIVLDSDSALYACWAPEGSDSSDRSTGFMLIAGIAALVAIMLVINRFRR